MFAIETASATESYRDRNEDRFVVLQADDRVVIAVVDGAGGSGSGDVAAETVLSEIRNEFERIHSAIEWTEFLTQVDFRVGVGEAAAVVVDIRPYGIAGASVGDCQAWMVKDDQITDLTRDQVRKPLLGSGAAEPKGFVRPQFDGILIIGTDGLFNYAKRPQLAGTLAATEFSTLPRTCIDSVRLPSRALWDDTTVVVARRKPRTTSRKRYTL